MKRKNQKMPGLVNDKDLGAVSGGMTALEQARWALLDNAVDAVNRGDVASALFFNAAYKASGKSP